MTSSPIKPEQEPDRDADTVSDPAHDERQGHDWSAEGGATEEGPATATEDEPTTPQDGGPRTAEQ